MKKMLSMVLALCMLLGVLPVMAEEAVTVEEPKIPDTWLEEGPFWVEVADEICWIVGMVGHVQGSVTVPSEMYVKDAPIKNESGYYIDRNYPVQIKAGAFKNQRNIVSLKFSEGIEYLPSNLCEGMTGLEKVELPKSLIEIENYCFKDCENLKSIDISRVQYIGRGAFENCKKLEEVTLSSSVKRIEDYTFRGCENLSKVEGTSELEWIGMDAFEGTMLAGGEEEYKYAGSYTDVYETGEFIEGLRVLSTLGIMEGYEDGTFKPAKLVTRAEAAAIMVRLLNKDENIEQCETVFSDVDSSHWASGYIQKASEDGIINGLEDGTFAPDESVTYHQMVKMLVCATGYEPIAIANGGWSGGGYMFAGDVSGITKGIGRSAKDVITRKTVSKLLINALEVHLLDENSYSAGLYANIEDEMRSPTILEKYFKFQILRGTVTKCEKTGRKWNVTVKIKKSHTHTQYYADGEIISFMTYMPDVNDFLGMEIMAAVRKTDDGKNEMLKSIAV